MLVFPLLLVAGLEAVLGLLQFALGDEGAVADGTYVNRNHFAGLLEMVFPFAVIYPVALLRPGRSRESPSALPALKACAVWAVATVILLGIIYSLSRMGFIAALTSLFVMAALGFGARLSAKKKWAAVGMVGILILLSFVILPPDQLIFRFADLSRGEKISANDRMLIWKETLHLIAAYPVFGCGLGGYESAFLKFSASSPNSTVDFAHNDYLQSLAELGVVGFLILGALMVAIVVKAVRVASQDSDGSGRWLGLACTGSIAAILLHSFVD